MKTIKRGDGYHLYIAAPDLYLELTDCDFAMFREFGKASVTVKLTEDVARKLGLLGGGNENRADR